MNNSDIEKKVREILKDHIDNYSSDFDEATEKIVSLITTTQKEAEKEECLCHCHAPFKYLATCRCIKNCIHCHPENFSTPKEGKETK